MSFDPIKFKFTPPPTIPSQAVISPTTNTLGIVIPVSNEFGSSIAASSKAAAIVTRLADLNATAAYLQAALISLVKTLGVAFDLSANPDLGRALARIYNATSPPTSMDISMYISLLEADINFLRFDLLNPSDSAVQIQPLQRADVGLAAKAFENSLIASGLYNQTLPVLLRTLAGDQVIFDSIDQVMRQYPILSIGQLTPAQLAASGSPSGSSSRSLNGSSVDVSDEFAGLLNGLLDQWEKGYAGVYTVVASPDPTETALPVVVATLSTQPSADLARLMTMLQNLVAFQHQTSIQQSHDSVDNLVLPRLLSDTIGHAGNMDYMHQVAVGPASNFGGGLGGLMTTLASVNPGSILGSGLTGAVSKASGGFNAPPLTQTQQATLSGIPEGLQILGANTAWATNEAKRQNTFIQTSIQRLGFRRISNQGNHTELLTSLKSISSSIGIIKSILQSGANTPKASGNTTSLNTNVVAPAVGLQSFGTLVNSLKSQSGSSFALDGNTLTVTPPQIPTAPTNVQALLARGGVNQITTQALRTPVNFIV